MAAEGSYAAGDQIVSGAVEAPQSVLSDQPGALDRRTYPRHAVDCAASITPIAGGGRVQARLADLSLGGCRIVTEQRFQPALLMRVEVQFELRGIAFRIVGVTVGSRASRSFAIRFLDMSARRQQALVEVLAEVAEINAAKTSASLEAGSSKVELAAAEAGRAIETTAHTAGVSIASGPAAAASPVAPEIRAAVVVGSARAVSQEKRAHGRHQVDTRARLLLVKTNIGMPGQILNLSQGGCRLRTDERFSVGIFVRVETEFYLHGMPFRLGGVTQAIMDRHTIGIRFLDMSDRKREQLTALIAEIEEAAAFSEVSKPAE